MISSKVIVKCHGIFARWPLIQREMLISPAEPFATNQIARVFSFHRCQCGDARVQAQDEHMLAEGIRQVLRDTARLAAPA